MKDIKETLKLAFDEWETAYGHLGQAEDHFQDCLDLLYEIEDKGDDSQNKHIKQWIELLEILTTDDYCFPDEVGEGWEEVHNLNLD